MSWWVGMDFDVGIMGRKAEVSKVELRTAPPQSWPSMLKKGPWPPGCRTVSPISLVSGCEQLSPTQKSLPAASFQPSVNRSSQTLHPKARTNCNQAWRKSGPLFPINRIRGPKSTDCTPPPRPPAPPPPFCPEHMHGLRAEAPSCMATRTLKHGLVLVSQLLANCLKIGEAPKQMVSL